MRVEVGYDHALPLVKVKPCSISILTILRIIKHVLTK